MAIDIHEHVNHDVSLPLNQVVLGDCVEVMAGWPEKSVDCIVTDPPYGISFMGKEWDRALPPRAAFEQMIRVLKPGALAFVMSSPRQDMLWRMLAMLEGVGFELRQSFISWIYKTGFPKAYDVSKGFDKKEGVLKERRLIGYEKFNLRDKRAYSQKSEMGYHGGDKGGFREITEPSSELAKEWLGWKSQTGLKPALECILMVNKPFSETTIVDNVLRWGTGAMNVDACRIPLKGEPQPTGSHDLTSWREKENRTDKQEWHPNITPVEGRFPANLLISDGALDTGGTTKSRKRPVPKGDINDLKPRQYGSYGAYRPKQYESGVNDEGSPYRYFDLDAWAEHHGFLDVAKPSRTERDFGLSSFSEVDGAHVNLSGRRYGGGNRENWKDPYKRPKVRNTHATVKPIKLMSYLIELGCPPKGIVVDPFVGSGTTCIAAKRLRRRWIGIEISPEYADIAEARINIRGPLDQFMEAEK